MATGEHSITTAFEADTQLTRPAAYSGGIEIVTARPGLRTFPARVSSSLGLCLKFGPPHEVMVEGRRVTFPADSLCVRTPGCVWGCEETGPVGFLSIDIGSDLLPEIDGPPRMQFAEASKLPNFRSLLNLLSSQAPQMTKDEALNRVVSVALDVAGISWEVDATSKALERAREFLEASIEAEPSLDDLAAAAGANKDVLVRGFRRRFGITPHAYLLMLKIAAAKESLARGHAPIDVAVTYSFADQSHFTRTFRRIVGLTPGAYRRAVHTMKRVDFVQDY